MKIQTTEAVRRFNAQIEIADLALSRHTAYKSCDWLSLERLHFKLLESGYSGLADAMKETAEALGYFRSTRAADPGQSPHTVFETRTKSADLNCDALPDCDVLRHRIERMQKSTRDLINTLHAVRLKRDEMRTTLKQSRQALIVALNGTPSDHPYSRQAREELKRLSSAALDRINAIILPSEV